MACLYRSSDSFANKKGEKKSGTKVAASKNGGLFPEKVSSFFSSERRFRAGTAIEKSRGGGTMEHGRIYGTVQRGKKKGRKEERKKGRRGY